MEIQILARNIDLTDAQNEFIERRVQYALCRFSTEVRTVQVTISDINGPRGGTDVLCRVKLVLKKGEVLAGDTDASVEAAIANVADRAARSLARQLDRQRDHQGTSMPGSVLR
jgi:ribosomal subunit interface protein